MSTTKKIIVAIALGLIIGIATLVFRVYYLFGWVPR